MRSSQLGLVKTKPYHTNQLSSQSRLTAEAAEVQQLGSRHAVAQSHACPAKPGRETHLIKLVEGKWQSPVLFWSLNVIYFPNERLYQVRVSQDLSWHRPVHGFHVNYLPERRKIRLLKPADDPKLCHVASNTDNSP